LTKRQLNSTNLDKQYIYSLSRMLARCRDYHCGNFSSSIKICMSYK